MVSCVFTRDGSTQVPLALDKPPQRQTASASAGAATLAELVVNIEYIEANQPALGIV